MLVIEGICASEGDCMRKTFATSLSAASLVLASALASVAGQYGPGVTDTEIKLGNTDLTRESVMKHAASLHNLTLPMLLPGITLLYCREGMLGI